MLESEALFLLVFSRIQIGVVLRFPVSYTEECSVAPEQGQRESLTDNFKYQGE
jgi:hypothetical protein